MFLNIKNIILQFFETYGYLKYLYTLAVYILCKYICILHTDAISKDNFVWYRIGCCS